jgi:hypothetical protein
MVFDYAIWSRTEAQRPILLVCEEAHRYVPKDESAKGQAVRKILERIAKEGRKYGVSLGLITQRPSDLAEGVLSQCGTIIAMRLNNDRDQACVRAAMPEGARGFLDAIPALRNRECIVCGEGVAIPIRVRFDDLEPEKRPASSDPSFAELWRQTGDEAGIIQRTIKRWRGHGRGAKPPDSLTPPLPCRGGGPFPRRREWWRGVAASPVSLQLAGHLVTPLINHGRSSPHHRDNGTALDAGVGRR